MVDELQRWCLECDLQIRPAHPRGPYPVISDYVDDLIVRSNRGEAKRVSENSSRVTRISEAKRVPLPDGSEALAMVITLGNTRGARPAFIHFENGTARDAERLDGEVKGASAHCLLRLTQDGTHVGRYRIVIEDVRGIGRTPITRLIGSELRAIAEQRGENFIDPDSGRRLQHRAVVEVHPRQSSEMREALAGTTSLPVTLIDTSAVPAFDENPDFTVRRHSLHVTVRPTEGRTIQQSLQNLARLGAAQDYDRMRISWKPRPTGRTSSTELATDLADLGTALFAQRIELELPTALSDCTDRVSDEFIALMSGVI